MRSVSISIDLNALRYNFSQAKKIAPQCKIFSVLKANAYGHGAVACAQALDQSDGFAVAVPSEAFALREAGIQQPILVVHGANDTKTLLKACELELQLCVHADHQLKLLKSVGKKLSKPLKLWIKLDSGMGRLGFPLQQTHSVQTELQTLPQLSLLGFLSHFSCADEPYNPFTRLQIDRFRSVISDRKIDTSLANSAGLLAWPESRFGWIRPGLMLYGANPLWPHPCTDLQAVMTVKAPLIAIRQMQAGHTIGYGNTYCCERDMTVGVIAIGYGDGYPRHVKPTCSVLLRGQRCRILGRVSMDSLVVDLSAVNEPSVGDLATLWGDGLPVEEIADPAGTLSYELLCQIRGQTSYTGLRR